MWIAPRRARRTAHGRPTCPRPQAWPEAAVTITPLSGNLVYRPQHDTALLIEALCTLELTGARVLDLCTGSGAVALKTAEKGAHVTAVDVSPHAVAAARALTEDHAADVDVVQERIEDYRPRTRFDVVVCNPPYVPTPPWEPVSGSAAYDDPALAWNAGPDGRDVLDVVCARLGELLRAHGTGLVVQSELADTARSTSGLARHGLRARVVRRRSIPFGPVLRSRRAWLTGAGYIRPACDTESIAVIRADRGLGCTRGAPR